MYNTYGINPQTLSYKTYQDLSLDIKENIHKIPQNIDLIVGIPRSGMIPAYMIGMVLSKNVITLNEFFTDNYQLKTTSRIKFTSEIKNILIVDDSISSGNTFVTVKNEINKLRLNTKYNLIYLAIYYKTEDYKNFIDITFKKLPSPRLFQWNYLNHVFLGTSAFDIDGLLCQDPSVEENDDGVKYKHFILNAKPLYIPQYKIPYLITSRLEKYRVETEGWLKTNNVKYDHLIMLNNCTAEERRKLNLHAKFKAEQYSKLNDIQLFMESNRNQAIEISKLTKKLCFCTSTDELFGREEGGK